MIEIRNLTHSLGSKRVLEQIDLVIPDNTVLGIVGINGAGKSTLLRLLSGVYVADEGCILYDGAPPTEAETRQSIFYLPDDPYYDAQTTPITLFRFYETFYPEIDRTAYTALLSEYQIPENGKLRNFSKGMRRQVFIALALAVKSQYLLLDEAFDGLDPLSRKIFKDAIIAWIEESGGTVLITSHSLRELEDFCDRFILIDAHTIKEQGDIAEHVGQLCKFELAFKEKVEESLFSALPTVSLSIRGKFASIVLRGDSDAMRERLSALSPVVMEEFALDFEEAFIYDVERNRGDRHEK